MSILNRFPRGWMAWVLPRPRFILGVVLLTLTASIWIVAARLQVRTDQRELISTRHQFISLQDRLDPSSFNGKTSFALAVRGPSQVMKVFAERFNGDSQHFHDILLSDIKAPLPALDNHRR